MMFMAIGNNPITLDEAGLASHTFCTRNLRVHSQDYLEGATVSGPRQQPLTNVEDARPSSEQTDDQELHGGDRENVYSRLLHPGNEGRRVAVLSWFKAGEAASLSQCDCEETQDKIDDADTFTEGVSKNAHLTGTAVIVTCGGVDKDVEEVEDACIALRDPLENVRDCDVDAMDKHLAHDLFGNIEKPLNKSEIISPW
jgi:hypothetical protein